MGTRDEGSPSGSSGEAARDTPGAADATSPVDVVRLRATVAELHDRDPFADGPRARPALWWCDPTDAALVLGSRQSVELLDTEAVARAGLGIVRRRSGGGAVVVSPESVVWIDLVLPAGDLTGDLTGDVRRSMIWAGERWRAALIAVGVPADRLTVHDGGMVAGDWSALVCFAGIGPGEVLLDGRKLVGLSQRRTRHGVRVQGQVARHGSLGVMPALFVDPPAVSLPDVAGWESLVASRLVEALADSLTAALASALTEAVTAR